MSKYERGSADKDKSPAHKIAWGNSYAGMTERLYERTDENTQELLRTSSTKDFSVYSYSALLKAITEAIAQARMEEVDNALRICAANGAENSRSDLMRRRAELSAILLAGGTASPAIGEAVTPVEEDVLAVRVPT